MPDFVLAGQRLIASVENARAPFLLDYSAINVNTPPSPGVTAETMWVTTPTLTFKNGRAYRLTAKGLASTSAVGAEVQIRAHKATVGGQILFDSFRISTPNAGNYGFEFSNIFTNTSGVDVTTVLVGSIFRVTGSTALVWVAASATSPAYLMTEDVGPAADFTGATAIT